MTKKSRFNFLYLIFPIVFFTLLFFYIWLGIDPKLYYQKQEPIFQLDWNFFQSFLNLPGGLLSYFSLYLSQFYFFS